MPRKRFTQGVLDGWSRSADTGSVISDTTPGLYARLLKRGVCFEWRGRLKRGKVITVRIGTWRGSGLSDEPAFSQLTVERARSVAANITEMARQGYDPRVSAKNPKPAPVSVGQAIDRYWREHQQHKRQGAEMVANLRRHLDLDRPLAAVTRDDLKAALEPYRLADRWSRAHRLKQDVCAFFRWCEDELGLDRSPAHRLRLPVSAPRRTRTPTVDECRAIFAAADGLTYHGRPAPHKAAFLRLLLLTGCRRDEIADLVWAEVRDDAIVLPPERTKQAREHVVPITAGIRQQLDGARALVCLAETRVFAGLGSLARLKDRAAELSGTSEWCFHDFRRSIRSHLRDADTDRDVIDKILGHASVGTDAHYNHARLLRQVREALELWERMLTS